MKIFKSIKWRLQIWYGLILVAVLAGFGFMAYQLERGRLMGRVDQELHRRIGVLADALRRPPPRGPETGKPFFNPPPGQFPNGGPPEQNPPPPRGFQLPPAAAHFFDSGGPDNYYFLIEGRDGGELARSTNVPSAAAAVIRDTPPSADPRVRLAAVDLGDYQMAVNALPSGERIWVGCAIAPELHELRTTALKLLAAGVVILIFGLLVGGWLVARALRPISEISFTAVKISAGDLSQRISAAESESELGRLATVLNSTFARLETAFAQQKQFAADAAHELRTPVAVMLAQTQTALNRERDAASYRQTVEACQRAAQRMRRLIESLLELARFDAGQETLKRERFDFAKTIADSLELARPLAEEKRVQIFCEAEPVEITGDAGRLGQVVTNLLTNAVQYNHPDGEVRVRLARQSGLAVLEIADTGPGIGREDLSRVFERFYRADRSRTGAGSAGLGLAICQAIVAAHGGTIEAASEIGAGTTFTVRLPI